MDDYNRADQCYREAKITGPYQQAFFKHVFGLFICPLLEDRKFIADHHSRLNELMSFHDKEIKSD